MARTVITETTTTETANPASEPTTKRVRTVLVEGMWQAAYNVVGLRDFVTELDRQAAPNGTYIEYERGTDGHVVRLSARWEERPDENDAKEGTNR